MKILFFCHYFPPEVNAPASRTHEHAKRWVSSGHEVTVVTSQPNAPSGRLFPGYRNRMFEAEFVDGIKVVRVWTFLAANAGSIRRIFNYLSFMVSGAFAGLFLSRPSIVVATSPQFFCGWAGVMVSRCRNLPFVLEVRDIWPDSIAAVGAISSPITIRFLSFLERLMYQSATHIVTVGDSYKDELEKRSVPTEKITVIPNSADLERFNLVPDQPLSVPTSQIQCVYVGTIGMASRLDLVLEAAEVFKHENDCPVQFSLIGDGADRPRLLAEAEERELDNVHFPGLIPKADLPATLRNASVCLVHLRKDPLFETVIPSKLFEAMAAERPIILGVRGAAAALVKKAGCGIVIEPESSRQLVEALKRIAKSSSESQQLGKAGRIFVEQEYSRDLWASNYLECLQRYGREISKKPQALS